MKQQDLLFNIYSRGRKKKGKKKIRVEFREKRTKYTEVGSAFTYSCLVLH